jgi:hypothetical protein
MMLAIPLRGQHLVFAGTCQLCGEIAAHVRPLFLAVNGTLTTLIKSRRLAAVKKIL